MVLVSRSGRIIGVRKLASVPGSWHARKLYIAGESPLGQRRSSSFRLHVHRDLPANTIVVPLFHHDRPAAVALGANLQWPYGYTATQPRPFQPRSPGTRKARPSLRAETQTGSLSRGRRARASARRPPRPGEPWSQRHHEMRPPRTRKALAALRSQPRPRPNLPAETQTGPRNPRPRPVLPAETAVHPGQDRRVPSPRRTETRPSSTHKVGSPPRTQPRPPCISKALARQNPAEITEHQ